MKNKNEILFKQSITYGLYFGIILITFSLVLWMLNVMPVKISINLLLFAVNLLLYGGILLWFTIRYRSESCGGYISYGQAFLFAMLVVLVSSLLSSFYSYIFNAFIDPGYMEKVINMTMESTEAWMRERGLPQERIDMALARLENREIPTAFKSAIQGIVSGLIMGLIISLITSAIAKKQEEVFEA